MSKKTIVIAGSVLTAGSLLIIVGLTVAGIREKINQPAEPLPRAESTAAAPAKLNTITLPAGTVLKGALEQSLRSDRVSAGQSFWLKITQPVMVNHRVAVPAGSRIYGQVIEANRSGRIKGRARLTLAFRRLETDSGNYSIAARTVTRVAPGTKKRDALIIGSGAGIGALIGGLAGGGKGAAIGAGIGGGAGTGVVLATRGKETQFARGEAVAVRLVEPVVVRPHT
jgi:hypothetical protein